MAKVYSGAVLYSIITGLSFLFGKLGLDHSSPLDLLAYRFTAAFLATLVPLAFGWVKLNINKTMLKKILPLAIFNPLLFFGFQAFGLDLTLSSEAGIILAVGPVFTMILASYFLKERTTTLQKLSILVSVFGVIYITVMKSSSIKFENMKGMIFLFISTLSLAIYSVMARRLTKDFSSMELSYVMIGISFISFNVSAIGKHIIDRDIASFVSPLANVNFIISILYLGILSSFLTSYLSNYVLSKVESYKMSVFTNLATVISVIAGVVFLNEDISYFHIIGSALIITGVIGANFFGAKAKDNL